MIKAQTSILSHLLILGGLASPSLLTAEEIPFSRAHELITTYCVECHNPADKKGSLDLAVLETEADYLADPHLLEDLEWVVAEKEMPVPSAPKQPTEAERKEMVAWFLQELMKIQNAMPNDPGRVVMPRMSSKDFDYTIQDLTGKDYELSAFLTSDTAGGEGFYNVGASQNLSIGQFESFMSVSKMLFDRARWVPGLGVWWMSTPAAAPESDGELAEFLKESWYQWHEKALQAAVNDHRRALRRNGPFEGFGAYLEAAWQYKNRAALGMPSASVEDIALSYEPPLFPSALSKTLAILENSDPGATRRWADNRIMQATVIAWNELPRATSSDPLAMREEIKKIDDRFELYRDSNEFSANFNITDIEIKHANGAEGSERRGFYHEGRGTVFIDLAKIAGQDLYLAATGRAYPGEFDPNIIWVDGTVTLEDGSERSWENVFRNVTNQDGRAMRFQNGSIRAETPGYIKMTVPEGAKKLVVSGTYAPDEDAVRLLRVMPGTQPPANYVEAFGERAVIGRKMNDPGVKKAFSDLHANTYLDHHALNLYDFDVEDVFVDAPEGVTNYVGVTKKSPADRNHYWTSLYSLTPGEVRSAADSKRTVEGREVWAALAAASAHQSLSASEKRSQAGRTVQEFAARAWRGLAAESEMDDLMAVYDNEIRLGESTETAVETAMRAVMMSPKALYRFTESAGSAQPYRLNDREIAVRLASVLWSGLPDPQLFELARQGRLQDPAVLDAQINRMLADPKADRFIEEFFGRWLHFAEFAGFGGPDQEKFEEWNEELSNDMHQEASLFIQYLIAEDKPLTDIFYADYTFLNKRLARHYGIEGVRHDDFRLVELDDPRRGGILGMGAFLTKTSTPLRTSPVHRGLWIYEDVLDLPVPEPPPVPLLSDDGVDEEGRSFVEQLRQHRENPACYSCHDRFDPMGVALENFDPIGRWRTKIEGTADVISTGEFRSGEQIEGIAGLKDYLREREDTLIEAFNTKLLGYTLGRSVLPTDKPTLEAMEAAMRSNDLSIRAAIRAALTSPQFLYRRDAELASK